MHQSASGPEAEKGAPPVTNGGDEAHQATEQTRTSTALGRLLPWLLGASLICFTGLVVIGAYDALIGLPAFARATPTPAFLAATEVKLADHDGGSVTVWQVGGNCEVGTALGQVSSGSGARILGDACYRPESKATYYRIALASGSTGWVETSDIVPAAEYTPPIPAETAEPRSTATPWPTPTPRPTQTPTPAPLPMGSSLSAGNWGLRVDRVEIVDALSSPSGDKTVEAAGRFVLVFMTVTNQGFRLGTLHASSVYVEDAEGNRYRNDDLASAYASSADCLDFALDISPDASACMVAAVDISEQSSFYVLSLSGASEYILLDLP